MTYFIYCDKLVSIIDKCIRTLFTVFHKLGARNNISVHPILSVCAGGITCWRLTRGTSDTNTNTTSHSCSSDTDCLSSLVLVL